MVGTRKSTKGKCAFKNGNIPWNKGIKDEVLQIEADCSTRNNSSLCHELSISTSYSSNSSDVSALNLQSINLSRPDKSIFVEALKTEAKWAGCKPDDITILPTKLRPVKQESQHHFGIDFRSSHHI